MCGSRQSKHESNSFLFSRFLQVIVNNFQVSARAASLESQLNSLVNQRSELEVKLEAGERRLRSLEEQRSKDAAVNEALKKSFAEEISELKKEKASSLESCIEDGLAMELLSSRR